MTDISLLFVIVASTLVGLVGLTKCIMASLKRIRRTNANKHQILTKEPNVTISIPSANTFGPSSKSPTSVPMICSSYFKSEFNRKSIDADKSSAFNRSTAAPESDFGHQNIQALQQDQHLAGHIPKSSCEGGSVLDKENELKKNILKTHDLLKKGEIGINVNNSHKEGKADDASYVVEMIENEDQAIEDTDIIKKNKDQEELFLKNQINALKKKLKILKLGS